MKYGKIYSFKNKDEAEVGRRYVFSDNLYRIDRLEDLEGDIHVVGDLESILEDDDHPFKGKTLRVGYQFIREVLEDEPVRMTEIQLAEWLAKGNGQWRQGDYGRFAYSCLCEYEDEPVEEGILIRHWHSDEWVEPTCEIYERDCLGKEAKA